MARKVKQKPRMELSQLTDPSMFDKYRISNSCLIKHNNIFKWFHGVKLRIDISLTNINIFIQYLYCYFEL